MKKPSKKEDLEMLRHLTSERLQDWQMAEDALQEAENKEIEKAGRSFETLNITKFCPIVDLHEWDRVGARLEIAIDSTCR